MFGSCAVHLVRYLGESWSSVGPLYVFHARLRESVARVRSRGVLCNNVRLSRISIIQIYTRDNASALVGDAVVHVVFLQTLLKVAERLPRLRKAIRAHIILEHLQSGGRDTKKPRDQLLLCDGIDIRLL